MCMKCTKDTINRSNNGGEPSKKQKTVDLDTNRLEAKDAALLSDSNAGSTIDSDNDTRMKDVDDDPDFEVEKEYGSLKRPFKPSKQIPGKINCPYCSKTGLTRLKTHLNHCRQIYRNRQIEDTIQSRFNTQKG
eukprot:TRINITY_DN16654_c0_g1_i1.p1 TRINITY_DN16654_c0_g1~~TRINITY_DN16654_c0_g1_i1.p1  ORF type:complete len:133 (+),score=11.17 TRINITY_DN16654_c0_g1_i1:198-596(+)